MEGIRHFGVGQRRMAVVAFTVVLLVLSGLTGLDQLLRPPMSASAQAATALSKSVQATTAQIPAASAAKAKAKAAGPKATPSQLTLKVDSARTSDISGGPK